MTENDETPVPDYLKMGRLDGQGAIVVGAGQGIGRQTCHALAQAGAQVICVDIDEERAKRIAADVKGFPLVADARSRDGAATVAAEAGKRFGAPDVLVDILGMARWSPLLDMSDEDWDWCFDMTLRHAFLLTQAVGRLMAERGSGAIVLISSTSGIFAAPNHSAYGAAKAGVLSLTMSAAAELGPRGIRVNAIVPGSIDTFRSLKRYANGAPRSPVVEALGRHGQSKDVAAAALFLASDLAGHITGQSVVVDGGAVIRDPYAHTMRPKAADEF